MTQQNVLFVRRDFTYINGFQLTYIDNTTMSVGTGQCRDSNNAMDICIGLTPESGPTTPAPVTMNFATHGIGGLDTGSLAANKMYSVFAVGDSTYNRPSGLIGTLQVNTSPLMPFGYDSYRLVGFFSTDDSSHIRAFYQYGDGNYRVISYYVNILISTVTTTTPTYITFNTCVPSNFGFATLGNLRIDLTVTTAGDIFNINNNINLTNNVNASLDYKYLQVSLYPQGSDTVAQVFWPGTAGSAAVNLQGYSFFL